MTPGQVMGERMTAGSSDGRWTVYLNRLDTALGRGDTYAMVYAWHLACLEARASRQWEGMVAVGEAALRIARATGLTLAFTAEARQALHVALSRAQRLCEAGQAACLGVLDAEADLSRQRAELVSARLDAHLAETALRRAAGTLTLPEEEP